MSFAAGPRPSLARAAALIATLGLVLPLLAACSATGSLPSNTVQPVPAAQYQHPELLADTSWLAERLNDPFVRVVDLSPLADYERGHLPGAVHVWWQDLVEINNVNYG